MQFSRHYDFSGYLLEMLNAENLKLSASNYYISEDFNSPNQINEIDYYYKWNIKDSSIMGRNIFSSSINYEPVKNININYEFANNNYGKNNSINNRR